MKKHNIGSIGSFQISVSEKFYNANYWKNLNEEEKKKALEEYKKVRQKIKKLNQFIFDKDKE